jgi:hypothetical protein
MELEPFLDGLASHLPHDVGLRELWIVVQVGLHLQPHQGALQQHRLQYHVMGPVTAQALLPSQGPCNSTGFSTMSGAL